jgi:hypothetical protein
MVVAVAVAVAAVAAVPVLPLNNAAYGLKGTYLVTFRKLSCSRMMHRFMTVSIPASLALEAASL